MQPSREIIFLSYEKDKFTEDVSTEFQLRRQNH